LEALLTISGKNYNRREKGPPETINSSLRRGKLLSFYHRYDICCRHSVW